MKRLAGLAPAALLAFSTLLSGCVATQKDVLELENQTDELKTQVTDLKKTIASMQTTQADMAVQMKQLHEDLTAYVETSKDAQTHMASLSAKLDALGVSVEQKVASIGTTLTAQQAKGIEEQKAAAARENPTDLFNTADVRLGVKDYDVAVKGFEEYVAKYPKGSLIDVATYKLGLSHFRLGHWESAGRQFAVVLEKYTKSEMTPSARLYYALCLVKMKKNYAEARQYLESIESDFPRSPEAKEAAAELKRLGGRKG